MYFELLLPSFETENKNILKIKSLAYCGDNTPLTPHALTSATKTEREMKKDQAQALNNKHVSCDNSLKLAGETPHFSRRPKSRIHFKISGCNKLFFFSKIEEKIETAL